MWYQWYAYRVPQWQVEGSFAVTKGKIRCRELGKMTKCRSRRAVGPMERITENLPPAS